MLARGAAAITFNEHLAHDGPAVFEHCRLGLEGIVSKRLDSPYRSGPSKVWLKSKNPASRAARARARLGFANGFPALPAVGKDAPINYR
jgi:ATP-dependent DNA ligase